MSRPQLLVQNLRDKEFGEQDLINVIAIYQGKAPGTVGIQRVFAGEESFRFPSEVTEGLVKTRVVYSYTLPQWRELLEACVLPETAQSLKEIMVPLLLYFREIRPGYFAGIEFDRSFGRECYGEILEMD
ncbi:hypothetical protein DCCM_2141 [Desulfocucumis palustris]|uniref:Uncharacterized protein n=1 Tax=Desulfocucumis palustris TaxID=1898651 RepID=A0A2L2XAP0_9FIRM|nr:hypothetical protein [Desulfocucumis palustris]GBF33044.1 hypothetical protein DCCM_2141 [Desulfocucumis palustris]